MKRNGKPIIKRGRKRKWSEETALVRARIPQTAKKKLQLIARAGSDESSIVCRYVMEGLKREGHLKEGQITRNEKEVA